MANEPATPHQMIETPPRLEDQPARTDGMLPAPAMPEPGINRRPNGAMPRNVEVELKLLADPERLKELSHAPAIVAHARNRGTVRLLKAVYYDTPSHALHRAGVTLRVRQIGKRFVQTLKMSPGDSVEPLHRGEWETPVATMMPDLQSLMPLISPGLRDVLSREPLQPVFTTEVRRHLRDLAMPAGMVQVAFDQGVVRAGDKSAPISEIELELKHGSAAALYELALPLSELGSVRPSIRSKAERGFDLALGAPPSVRKAGTALCAEDASLDDAFTAFLQSGLGQLLVNQAAAEDGRDPEGIHQLRVALRRLRCALSLLRSLAPSAALDAFRADAKWLASSLSGARNWDVFLAEVLTEVAQGCGPLDGFDAIREIAERSRASSYAAACEALAERRAGRFQLALGAWIEQRGWRCNVSGDNLAALAAPAISFASRVLARHHGKVLKRGRNWQELSPEARHDLRLAVKKLRYAADFFLPLFGDQGSARRYARRLGRLQDRLGCYNDAATTRQLVAQLPVETVPAAAREALGAVIGWQACRLAGAEPDLQTAWRRFRRAPRPWSGRRSDHREG